MTCHSKKFIRLACLATIYFAALSCSLAKNANGTITDKSISEVVASNKSLLGRIDNQLKKLPALSASSFFRDESDLVELILRSGDCDRAHKIMLKSDKSYLELYCLVMGLTGRSVELPEKVEPFRTNFGVRRRLRNEECSFEYLCEVPMRHGIALKHVVENDYKAAVAEYRAICKLARFGGEYSKVAISIAFEVLQSSGPKPCIEVLEELSEGKEIMFRRLSMEMFFADPKKTAELKQALLPDHVEVFLDELSLTLTRNSVMDLAEAKHIVPFALSIIPELQESDAARLRTILIDSDSVDSATKDRLSAECLQWLQTNPKGNQRRAIDVINPWLLANGKLDQLKTLAMQVKEKSRFKYATVITNAMRAARYDYPKEMVKIAGWLPDPEEFRSSHGLQADIADILIEARQFGLAENWLKHVENEEKKNLLAAKLEMYSDLLAKEILSPDLFVAGVEKLIAQSKATASDFYSEVGNDFLAETASRHGVKAALEIARRLPDDAISYNTSRPNELVTALLRRKHFEGVLLVADLITPEELTHHTFGLHLRLAPSKYPAEWVDQFGKKFRGNRHLLRRQIRDAIAKRDKSKALRLHQRELTVSGECTTAYSFVHVGWEDKCYDAVKLVASRRPKPRVMELEAIAKIADALCLMKGNNAAINFIDRHTKNLKERLRLYGSLESEYLGNCSMTVWLYTAP